MKLGLTTAAGLVLAGVPMAQMGQLEWTNTSGYQPNLFTGHVLTQPAVDGGGPSVLYAPSEADDVAYRAAIAAAVGGTCDYFDARNDTPSVALMSGYDCVYTWANFAYANNVLFGDNLAAANDAGVDVVLGVFCTYTTGNFLSGQIMTPAYCPVVSPLGNNHFSTASYAGDGGTCIYNGISTLSCNFRDFLVTQGNGAVDGTYTDGEICGAIRPNPGGGAGDVIYNNGSGALALGCGGDYALMAGNSCTCDAGSGTFGSCTVRNGSGINPVIFSCQGVPIAGSTWNSFVEGGKGVTGTIVAISNGGPSSGSFIYGWEVLITGDIIIDVVAGSNHSIPVPPGASGAAASTQGARFTATTAQLANAIDVVVGG